MSNKLKIFLIVACCVVSSFWTEVQGADEEKDQRGESAAAVRYVAPKQDVRSFLGEGVPAGVVVSFAGEIPLADGWLLCDGEPHSSELFSELYKVIGERFTPADIIAINKRLVREKLFCVPDLKGRTVFGVDERGLRVTSNNKLGETGGEESQFITMDNLPLHDDRFHDIAKKNGIKVGVIDTTGTSSVSGRGKVEPYNNMPPYQALNYIISTGKRNERHDDQNVIDKPTATVDYNNFKAQLANIMQQESMSIYDGLQRREDGLKIINRTSNSHCIYQANDQQSIDISYALIGNTTLTRLEIGGGSSITHVGAVAIAKSLSTNTALTYLDLWGSRIGDVGAIALAEALSINRTVITLNLTNSGVRVEGAKALAKALEENTTLKVLGLGDSAIDVEGAEALAQNTTLTTLYLAGSGGKGMGHIGAEALARNTTLKSLCLWGHCVGDAGAEALSQNLTLKILDLQRNMIGDIGAKALAQNTTINKLILGKNGNTSDSNNITDDGEGYFKNSQNPNFRDLSPLYATHPNFRDFIL